MSEGETTTRVFSNTRLGMHADGDDLIVTAQDDWAAVGITPELVERGLRRHPAARAVVIDLSATSGEVTGSRVLASIARLRVGLQARGIGLVLRHPHPRLFEHLRIVGVDRIATVIPRPG